MTDNGQSHYQTDVLATHFGLQDSPSLAPAILFGVPVGQFTRLLRRVSVVYPSSDIG